MNSTPDANIVGEWAMGLFAQDADDLLTTCLEAAQQIKTISDHDLTLEIKEITTPHTPNIDPNSQDSDISRLNPILNILAPEGYQWSVIITGGEKKIGYWKN